MLLRQRYTAGSITESVSYYTFHPGQTSPATLINQTGFLIQVALSEKALRHRRRR